MGLVPFLFKGNHFRPLISLPVSETYSRLRSAGKKGSQGRLRPPNNEEANIYVRIADSRFLSILPSCSVLPFQSLNTLDERERSWCLMALTDTNPAHHVTAVPGREGGAACSHSLAEESGNKPLEYASGFLHCTAGCLQPSDHL